MTLHTVDLQVNSDLGSFFRNKVLLLSYYFVATHILQKPRITIHIPNRPDMQFETHRGCLQDNVDAAAAALILEAYFRNPKGAYRIK